jgi:hypothetical protein
MSSILKKLHLGYAVFNFENGNISPDIECKLSTLDPEILGITITDRQDMMTLRIECSKYGSQKPNRCRNDLQNGPPSFCIPRKILESHLDEEFAIAEIASMFSVSESTIYRRMRCYGLSKLDFTDVSDNDLDEHVSDRTKEFPRCGESMDL